ncbi:histidine phosphatase family protein [Azospirillum canadense]|uniref:histidine phosphatase family protein n=1 Tax=Azospirillum canadense TaxID=403962 RepID=UPI0022266E5E|nr:histidine phosphatase family protein [Azospirillum canadense]MCW2238723.1 putative phosphoglycerate mutase [Azospirillum canadense]
MNDRWFLFMRHGETDYNRRKVRCGGDVDIPLTEAGERQAHDTARLLAEGSDRIDAIIASPLIRTRRTAEIVLSVLGDVPFHLHDGLIERRLGAWNGMGIPETQPLIDAKETPPGGEGEAEFRERIRRTLEDIAGHGHRLPLLVGSKGVGRMLGLILGDERPPMGNAAVLRFRLPLKIA